MRSDGLDIAARLRRTAKTFRGMPSELARSMSVTLSLHGQGETQIAELALDIAGEFDLVASIESTPPLVTVEFVRAAPSGGE